MDREVLAERISSLRETRAQFTWLALPPIDSRDRVMMPPAERLYPTGGDVATVIGRAAALVRERDQ